MGNEPRISKPLTAIAGLLRSGIPLSDPLRLNILGGFCRCFGGWVERRNGAYRFELDPHDYFQREMALDCYEREVCGIYNRVLRPGDTYVDVGTQLGFLASVASRAIGSRGAMVLFEPDPRALARLKKTLSGAAAATPPRTVLVEKACSDRGGVLTLELSDILGQSSLVGTAFRKAAGQRVEVPLTRLDQELQKAEVASIRLLKMDVEGHEIRALTGLGDFLASRKIDMLLLERNEVLLSRTGYSGCHLHALLAVHGYVGIHVESGMPITPSSLKEPVLLDNVFYAKDAETLKAVFGPDAGSEPLERFNQGDIAQWVREAQVPGEPAIRVRLLIAEAREGQIQSAIEKGLAFLKEFPEWPDFRGHLAHWLVGSGDILRAKTLYCEILQRTPDDAEAKRCLEELDRPSS